MQISIHRVGSGDLVAIERVVIALSVPASFSVFTFLRCLLVHCCKTLSLQRTILNSCHLEECDILVARLGQETRSSVAVVVLFILRIVSRLSTVDGRLLRFLSELFSSPFKLLYQRVYTVFWFLFCHGATVFCILESCERRLLPSNFLAILHQ